MKNYRRIVIGILILVETISIFLTIKSFSNGTIKMIKDEEVKKSSKHNTLNKKNFSMYVEKPNGEYEEYVETNTWPKGKYYLNASKADCSDLSGNKISNVVSGTRDAVTVTSNKTVFCYIYFDLDTIEPTVNFSLTQAISGTPLQIGDWTTESIRVSQSFVDNESGINPLSLQWSYDGESWQNSSNTSSTSFSEIWQDNSSNIGYYKICDYADNCTTTPVDLLIDKLAPTVNITYSGSTMSASVLDSESGIVGYQITDTSTKPTSGWTNVTKSNSYTVPGTTLTSGTKYIHVIDSVGNIGTSGVSVSSAILKKNATSTLNVSWTSQPTCASSNVSIASCSVSGTSGNYTITITGLTQGNANITVSTSGGSVGRVVKVTVDTTVPTLNYSNRANGSAYNGDWTKYIVYSDLTFSDTGGAGIDKDSLQWGYSNTPWYNVTNNTSTSSYTMGWPDEVNTTGYVKICDLANNCSQVTFPLKIDKTVPTLNYSNRANGSAYSGDWTKYTVYSDLTFSDTGGAGINKDSLQWGYSNTPWYNVTNNTSTSSYTMGWPDEVNTTGYVKICDLASNCSQVTFPLKIDKTVPTLNYSNRANGSAYNGDWTKYIVYSDLTFSDTGGAGINKDSLQWGYSNTPWYNVTNNTSTSAYTMPWGNEINDTGYVKICDLASNCSQVTFPLKIDQSAPTISKTLTSNGAAYGGDWTKYNVDVTLGFSDTGGSTINASSLQWSYDGSTWHSSSNSSKTSFSDSWGENSANKGNYKICDIAGNCSTTSFDVKVDKTAPTLNYSNTSNGSAYNGAWTRYSVVTTLTFSDQKSGINKDSLQWGETNTPWYDITDNTSTSTYTSTWGGSRESTGYFKICDAVTNCSEVSFPLKIDKVVPTYSFSRSGSSVTVTCSDAHTPTGGKTVTLSGSSTTVSGTCSDAAGNTASYSKTYYYNSNSGCGCPTGYSTQTVNGTYGCWKSWTGTNVTTGVEHYCDYSGGGYTTRNVTLSDMTKCTPTAYKACNSVNNGYIYYTGCQSSVSCGSSYDYQNGSYCYDNTSYSSCWHE